MTALIDIVHYLLKSHPRKHELFNGRVTKTIYLADWRSALKRGRQISGIEWFFDTSGPFVRDVKDAVERHPHLVRMKRTETPYHFSDNLFEIADEDYAPIFPGKEILDFVIDLTGEKRWWDFVRLVYSTYPMLTVDRYDRLDLVERAEQFHADRRRDGAAT